MTTPELAGQSHFAEYGAIAVIVVLTATVVFALMTAPDTPRYGPSDLTTDLGKLAQVYGAYVWAFLLLAGALTAMRRAGEPVPGKEPASAEG